MKKLLFLFLSILIILPLFTSSVALAAGPLDPTVDPPPGIIEDLTADDVVKIIINVRNWFAGIVMIIAVGVVLFAGFTYMTAGGDDKKIGLARKMLLNAVIGIVIALLAYGIVSLVSNVLNDLRGA